MSVNTVTVNNTGEKLGELVFPNKETFKSKNNIASLDANGKLVLSQSPYTAGYGIRINNLGVISATGGGSGSGDDHNKGWFVTPEQLPATGENGDYAVVGTTNTIWVWNSDTLAWMDSGARSQIESVNGVSPDSSGNVTITSTNIPDIAETYATKTSLDSKQNKFDNNLITANKTIVGAINEIFNKDNSLSDLSKIELAPGSTTGLLLMPNGENYVKPEIGQFIDYKIKIFAKSVDNTKFEKYSVNFFAINNNDTSIITSSPTCESVSFAGGPLINNVDVKSNTEDSTKIEFSVTTKSDNVVLYTALNKTIINNII